MTITNGYTDLATLKGSDLINISASDTTSDALLEVIIEAASREIDADCGQYFYKSASDETRYYTAEWNDKFRLPDPLTSLTALATDGDGSYTYSDAWTTADYDLAPYNASAKNEPYTALEVKIGSAYAFTCQRRGVKITGIFGWPAVPKKITVACLQLSARMFKRLSTPLGVASMAALGEVQVAIKEKDPDYWGYLAEYMGKA